MKKKMMKLFSIVLAFALSFSFTRTVSFAQYSGTDSYWDKFSSDYYYRQMNDEQKALYDKLYEKCMELLTTEKDCDNLIEGQYYTDYVEYDESLGSINNSDVVKATVYTFSNSNPQFYFLAGDNIHGYYTYYGSGSNRYGFRYYVAIRVYDDFAKGSDRKSYTDKFSSTIDSYMSVINAGTTAYEKERIAHGIITTRLSYNTGAKYNQSSASAFLTTSSVCAGYSEGLELLLNAAGLECITVTSGDTNKSNAHEWLEVKLDGTWYAVDVTWDDPVGWFAIPSEKFLNVSDATLLAADKEQGKSGSHKPDAYYALLNRPDCDYDYPDKDPNADPTDPVNPDPVEPVNPDPVEPVNPDPVEPVNPDPVAPEPDGTGADDYGLTGTYTNDDGDTALFRLYNPNTWEHFYTNDVAERRSLILAGWNGEGIIGYFPTSASFNTQVMYRFRNPNTGDHHYASDPEEIGRIMFAGWEPEGTSFYSLKQGMGEPIYRLYNPNAVTGIHHYTSNKEEKDYLVSIGWKDEGISWYAASK